MPDVDKVQIKVDGTALADDVHNDLAFVRVEESVQLPDAFQVHFYDPFFQLFDRKLFKIGSAIEVAFRAGSSLVTVTKGEVTAITIEQGRGTGNELVIAGFDKLHRLHKKPKSHTYLNMTDSAIVSKIAGDNGLSASVDSTSETHQYVVQHGQTDYEFIRERADRNGYHVYFADGKLAFKKKPAATGSAPALAWGDNLTKFRVRLSASERADDVTVKGWDATQKQVITGKATVASDLSMKYTTAPVLATVEQQAKSSFGTVSRMAGHIPVETQAEAKALAGSFLLKAAGGEVVVRGEALGNPNIAAGATVTISGVGESLSGSYTLTSVEHVYGAEISYTTRFVSSGKDPDSLSELLSGGRSAEGATQGWGGLAVGVVTNANDPDKLGRVKVKIPVLSEEDETAWARVASPGGGANRGLSVLPEVQDEVLVGFEFGDMRRPVILGGLWNKTDTPPPTTEVKDGKVRTRVWQSRAGHKIELVDDDSAPTVTIAFKGSTSTIELTKDGVTVKTDKSLTLEGKDIEVKASGKLALSGSQGVSIKGGKVEINGSPDVTVSAPQIKLN